MIQLSVKDSHIYEKSVLSKCICFFQFKCCGVTNASDYSKYFSDGTVPLSCCDPASLNVDLSGNPSCKQTTAYPKGCQLDFTEFVEKNIYIVGAVAVGLASIEVSFRAILAFI